VSGGVVCDVRVCGTCSSATDALVRALLLDRMMCDVCAYRMVFIELGGIVMRN
jgi:hypothetical protein